MKRPVTIGDEADTLKFEAPDSPGSNANGNDVGRYGKGERRKKTVTPKQLEANRRNALRSTGPKTHEGKARVRLNAMKHGILAQEILLPGEDARAYADFQHRLWDDWQPLGTQEEFLLGVILREIWNLGRASRLETAILAVEMYKIDLERAKAEALRYQRDPLDELANDEQTIITDEPKHRQAIAQAKNADALLGGRFATFGRAFVRVVEGADPFSKLNRYVTTILRRLDKAFANLRRLQQARRGAIEGSSPRGRARPQGSLGVRGDSYQTKPS